MPDSTSRPEPDEAWDDLLRELRRQPVAQLRPYFYGRVQARLAAETNRAWLPGWVRRPAYALLLGALVLVLNGDGAALASEPTPVAAGATAPR